MIVEKFEESSGNEVANWQYEFAEKKKTKKVTFYFLLAAVPCSRHVKLILRTARPTVGDICYHVINRKNGGLEVFHKHDDYLPFAEMMHEACR